jgi:hypothetical protein
VLILPVNLWYSEAIGRLARSRWLSLGLFNILLSRDPAPHPIQKKKKRQEERKKKKEARNRRRWERSGRRKATAAAAPPRATLKSPLGDSASLSLLRPLPGGSAKPGVGLCVRFLFLIFIF